MTAGMDADRNAELEEDNSRLRRLLDGRDTPAELRHRLRSTLSLLRAVIRRSAVTERDLPSYVAHLEDRLDAVTRAQALADQHGEVNLQTLLADELLLYGASEGERLMLSGPDVQFRPREGQILALAIHELAVNAVEHGALGADAGRIEVSWSVAGAEADRSLLFTWKELGASSAAGPGSPGFGTEVLTRMLPYDLKAETEVTAAPDGLRCTIRFPLPETVGRVAPGPAAQPG